MLRRFLAFTSWVCSKFVFISTNATVSFSGRSSARGVGLNAFWKSSVPMTRRNVRSIAAKTPPNIFWEGIWIWRFFLSFEASVFEASVFADLLGFATLAVLAGLVALVALVVLVDLVAFVSLLNNEGFFCFLSFCFSMRRLFFSEDLRPIG